MKLFSQEYKDYTNIWTIFGIKIKFKDLGAKQRVEELASRLFEIEHDMQYLRLLNEKNDLPRVEILKNKLAKIKQTPEYFRSIDKFNYLDILLGCDPIVQKHHYNLDGAYVCWGIRTFERHAKTMAFAHRAGKDVLFIEDGFLRSADTFANKKADAKYIKGISFTVDDMSSYYDATKVTRIEQMLNDRTLVITDEQKERARKCIDKIVETHLTKYNHQPIFEPKIGREGVKKVLVIDQSYGDMSILKGLADDKTFENMLNKAIEENPDADIIVKTHPDAMTGNFGGYYTGLKQHDNVYTQTEPINPISLIKYVDKVYVCTTQFGFEALMCGKEVRTFGMPFYAGWGLTQDEQVCERRTNTRTIEEMFYIAYILYSYYVNPDTHKICEIEEAMEYLLNLRDEYSKIK